MKKKSERYSYKKLAQPNKRQQIKLNNDTVLNDKKKSIKAKSSEKTPYQGPQIFQKIKIGIKSPLNQIRMKTDVDQVQAKSKINYSSVNNTDKNDKIKPVINLNQTKRSYHQRNASQIQTKNRTIKKLKLNHELFKMIKDSSLEKYDAPMSGKNAYQTFRRPHQSHRSAYKKNVLQDYVSGSLQNLRRKKSQMSSRSGHQRPYVKKQNRNQINIKQTKIKNILLVNEQQPATEYLKNKKQNKQGEKYEENQITSNEEQQTKTKQTKRQSRFQKRQIHRKIYTQKDESLQKFQIKFQKVNKYDLSKEQIQMFGDRFPDGFEKIKLLGRGGFSLVWLGQHKKSKKRYAVKQIITQSNHQTHIKQIWFGTYFFQFGGAPKAQFADHPGINNLVKLYYYFINKKDTWILYQKCGDSLGNCLYDLKGERVNSEKMYRVHHKPLYQKIRKNQNELRRILLQVAKALQLLADNNIIHSDLKTENILVRQKTQEQLISNSHENSISCIAQIKLIDYGSSFVFNNLRQFSMATPQYMAPQVLNFILYENQMQYIQKLLDYVQKYNRPWVIDMWSLGCVLLQIVSGVPLWMSLKTIVVRPGQQKQHIKYGLFAVKGRVFEKIIRKQIQVIQNLDHYLQQQNYSGIKLQDDLKALLKKMLALNPQKRISPCQVIQFLQEMLQNNQQNQSLNDEKQTIH